MTTLILLRHGYSLYNKEKRYTGQADIPLDEIGIAQAGEAAAYLLKNYKIDAIYASDLSRAMNTVRPVADALGLQVTPRKGLRELNVGHWTHNTISEIAERFPEETATYRSGNGYFRIEGGECYAEMIGRMDYELRRIARAHWGKTVLVGSHGGAIRSLLVNWTKTPVDNFKTAPFCSNASITVAEFDGREFTPKVIGFTGHLKEKTY